MVKAKLKIVWDEKAIESLKDIVSYIEQDSFTAAQKVKKKIIATAKSLQKFPQKFSVELYINDIKYRSVALWSYKIIYRVTETEIRIITIFHTSRNPTEMMK